VKNHRIYQTDLTPSNTQVSLSCVLLACKNLAIFTCTVCACEVLASEVESVCLWFVCVFACFFNQHQFVGGEGVQFSYLIFLVVSGSAVDCLDTPSVARILSGGALFLAKKVDDLFLVIALKDRLNIPPNLTRPAKTVLNIALAGGCTSCPGGVHLHILPVNYV